MLFAITLVCWGLGDMDVPGWWWVLALWIDCGSANREVKK